MKKLLKFKFAFLLVVCLATVAFAESKKTADWSVEPEAMYTLDIDGKKINLQREKVVEIKGEFKNPKIKLFIEPYKEFAYGGISVKYPQYFGFEADIEDENVKMWNLSGTNGVLMIQRYSLEMDHEMMAQMLVPRYGPENARLTECSMEFMGKNVAGTRVIATFGGTAISQEVYSFKLASGSVLLIIQDGIDEKAQHTKEGLELKKIVSESFKLTK